MAQRRRGERVLGPYYLRGKWRIVVVAETGDRVNREFENEAEARQVVRSLNRRLSGDEKTIADALTAYEDFMRIEKGNKPRTIEDTSWRIGKFFPDASELLASLTSQKCAGYYARLREHKTHSGESIAVDSHRNILAAAKSFLKWCTEKRWLPRNPLDSVKGVGRRRHGKEQLRLDEARKWMVVALALADEGEEGAVGALVALVMGLRASEIVSRFVRDLDDGGRLLWIPFSKTPAGKRTLEVPELLQPHLLALAEGKKPEDLLFGYHYRDWVREWVQRICTKAGVPTVTAHSMRGLHGTIAVENGITGHVVAASLGHDSQTTTFQSYVAPGAGASVQQQRLLATLANQKAPN